MGYFCFQLVPLWLVNIAVRSGILKLFTNLYSVPFTTLTLDVVKDLTDNEDLQVGIFVFILSWEATLWLVLSRGEGAW